MKRVAPLIAGLLFGLGLCLSGMTDPHKVLAFLDLAGVWDPSLALVMGGAILVAFFAFRLAPKGAFSPANGKIDLRLAGGAAVFGVGWGLVGLCPGPALADLGFLDPRALGFVLAMAAGMRLADASTARVSTAAVSEDG
jgi:uncharacterized membrane protein YedE/YeeE